MASPDLAINPYAGGSLSCETDEQWRARLRAETLESVGQYAKTRAASRFSDPTLSHRVHEAARGNHAAAALLCRTYREALKAKQLDALPFGARLFVQSLIAANGGKIPDFRAGRPMAAHRAFALAVAVEVERVRGMTVERALCEVAKRARTACRSTRDTIEKAHKTWRCTPAMRAELASRQAAAGSNAPHQVDLRALAKLERGPLPKPPRPKIR